MINNWLNVSYKLDPDRNMPICFLEDSYSKLFKKLDINVGLIRTNGTVKSHVDPIEFTKNTQLTLIKVLYADDDFYLYINNHEQILIEGNFYIFNPNVEHALLRKGFSNNLTIEGNTVIGLYDFKYDEIAKGLSYNEIKKATKILNNLYNSNIT